MFLHFFFIFCFFWDFSIFVWFFWFFSFFIFIILSFFEIYLWIFSLPLCKNFWISAHCWLKILKYLDFLIFFSFPPPDNICAGPLLPRTRLRQTRPPPDPPKFRVFFPPAHIFALFRSLSGVFSWNFGGVFEAFGAAGVSHDSPRTPNVHIWGSRPSKNTTKFPQEDPQRERKKSENGRGGGKKKRKILGPPPSGSHPSSPNPWGPNFFLVWAPPLWAQPLWAHDPSGPTLQTFSGFGSLRSSFYHVAHLFFFCAILSFFDFFFLKFSPKPQTGFQFGRGLLPPQTSN